MPPPDPDAYNFDAHQAEMLDALAALVRHESPSRDKAALDALSEKIVGRFTAIGGRAERLPNEAGGDHYWVRFAGSTPGAPALVMAHFDTVWPSGTLARMPFSVSDGIARGPGVYDMKAAFVLAEFALRSLLGRPGGLSRPVELLLTSDEEIGSPDSRPHIEAIAGRAAFVLVLEPPLADGSLKTARKGVGRFRLEVEGRAAHAGVEPEKGLSAVVELAHQILAAQGLARPELGTTINVGLIRGGTTPNVVPAEAWAEVDVRASTLDEADRLVKEFSALRPVLDGTKLRVEAAFNRPPMERTPAIAALFGRAREVGRSLGLDLQEGSTGGASDGNFTAALGVPTLDGLGVPGGGAHADHEHIVVAELPRRAALLAALLDRL